MRFNKKPWRGAIQIAFLMMMMTMLGCTKYARIRNAAESGDPQKMYEFGSYLISERPINFYSDAHEGKIWLTKAAEKGHVGAMEELGSIYELDVTPAGQEKTWYWYTKAAKAGSRPSMNRLGQAYQFGELGLAKDEAKANYWYAKFKSAGEEEDWDRVRRSAQMGNAIAMVSLGEKSETAQTPDGNKQAVEWYTKAAQAGSKDAMMRLVNAYQHGELGLAKDQGKSDFWFHKWQEAMGAK